MITLLVGLLLAQEPGKWTTRAAGPAERHGHAACYSVGEAGMFVFGGQSSKEMKYRNDLWFYSPKDDKWTEKPAAGDPPPPRAFARAVWDPKKRLMWMSGGWDGEKLLGDLWSYNPVKDAWAQVKPAGEEVPPARDQHAMCWDARKGRILLYGGRLEVFPFRGADDVWAFDTNGLKWIRLRIGPGMRSQHAMCWTPGGAVVHGGVRLSGQSLDDLWGYDSDKDQWTERTRGQSVRSGHAMDWDPTKKRVIVFGGGDTDDVVTWDPKKDSWGRGQRGPSARSHASGVFTAEHFLVFGGCTGGPQGQDVGSELWAFSVAGK